MKVAQLCLTLCDSMDCSLPGSSVHGILQARRLEWAAMPFSRGSFRLGDGTRVSCIGRQILCPLSHWGSPLEKLEWDAISSSRDLPDPGTESVSLVSPALADKFFAR